MADIDRLQLVSLTDANCELVIILEASWEPSRPRWRVRFDMYPAYRNIDEAYRLDLWSWLDESNQRCGSTFTVEETQPFSSWGTGYIHHVYPEMRHFVISTLDDTIEILSPEEPIREITDPAEPGTPFPGKSQHLYLGEDDDEIERFSAEIEERKKKHS